MEKNKRNRILIFALLAAALMSVSLVVIIQPQPKTVKEAYGSYSLDPSMDLIDRLRNNTLYGNNSELTNPSTIYNNITSNLSMSLLIYFQDTNLPKSSVFYNYTVTVISSNPSWSHVSYFHSGSVTIDSGYSYRIPLNVNISSNVSFGKKINEELGFGDSGTFSLLFGVALSSSIGTATGNMTIAIGSVTDQVTGPSYSDLSGAIFKNVEIPGRIIIPLQVEYAYPILAVSAILFALAGTQVERKKKSYLEKFKAENHDAIVELASGPPQGSIEVKSPRDILRMAVLLEKPAFFNENYIFVEMDGKTYFAEIRDED
jgi:hypothetical protein